MTARPGRIKLDQKIDLRHPREFMDDAFRDYEKLVYAQLDEELTKTFAFETKGIFRD